MISSIHLELARAEGALVRVLGLTERRGYTALAVNAEPEGDHTLWLRMTVRSDRPIEQLVLQLRKLLDVRAVQALTDAPALAVAK